MLKGLRVGSGLDVGTGAAASKIGATEADAVAALVTTTVGACVTGMLTTGSVMLEVVTGGTVMRQEAVDCQQRNNGSCHQECLCCNSATLMNTERELCGHSSPAVAAEVGRTVTAGAVVAGGTGACVCRCRVLVAEGAAVCCTGAGEGCRNGTAAEG